MGEHDSLSVPLATLVDFVVLSLFIYLLLRWSRDARALRVTLGILGLEVRIRTVPIEVTNVALGLMILDAVSAQVHLRGSSSALGAMEDAPLAARADVDNLSQGVHDIALGVLRSLPRGIAVDAISPERITVRLAKREH